jgi:predicted AAA+ superfamily ATPase
MKRDELSHLSKWKESADRKPLIIRGGRQTGKTWLMREFGRTSYQKIAYVNFESNPSLKNLFAENFDIRRKFRSC